MCSKSLASVSALRFLSRLLDRDRPNLYAVDRLLPAVHEHGGVRAAYGVEHADDDAVGAGRQGGQRHVVHVDHDAAGAPGGGGEAALPGRRIALSHGGVIGPSWSIIRRATAYDVKGFDTSFYNCNDWEFYTRVAAMGATFRRIDTVVALYRTVEGSRLVDNTTISAENARRVLAHPYLAARL